MRPGAGTPELASLVAGIALIALGALLLLDALGAFELSFAVLAPAVCAAMGSILLVRGLTRDEP